MDPFYGKLCHLEELGFEYALTILTTVTSRPTPGAGHHRRGLQDAVGARGGPADPARPPGRRARLPLGRARRLAARRGSAEIRIGDRLEIIPDYHDTTTFRHDAFVGLRGGVVEAVIPLLARGKLV